MRRIELCISPVMYDLREIRDGHCTVVVDILRASTSICAAFMAGAECVVPLASLDELPFYRDLGYILASERDGKKVEGAVCGNSPTEYLTMDLKGKRLAYSTTNGTVAILKASSSRRLFVGAFANISALVDAVVACPQDIVVLCAGWKEAVSLEDTLFAGAFISRLLSRSDGDGQPLYATANDAAVMAVDLFAAAGDDLYAYCGKATHVERLRKLDYDNDIRFALRMDTCRLVPQMDPSEAPRLVCG